MHIRTLSIDGPKNLDHLLEETLEIELSDGTKVLIELFERRPGSIDISIRGDTMGLRPVAGNKISMGRA